MAGRFFTSWRRRAGPDGDPVRRYIGQLHRQQRRQGAQDVVGVGQLEHAGQTQPGHPGVAAQRTRAVAAQFAQEAVQAHGIGAQHAAQPVRRAIQRLRRALQGAVVPRDALSGRNRVGAVVGALPEGQPGHHAEQAVGIVLAQPEVRRLRADHAAAGQHAAGAVGFEVDFAAVQAQAEQAGAVVQADGGAGIQAQLRARAQRHRAGFAGAGAQVGQPAAVPGAPQRGPGGRRRRQQCDQGFQHRAAVPRAAQGGSAYGRRDAVEHARQPAGALPGAFVLGMAGAPVVAGLDFVGAGLAGAQPHEPAGGLARHPALDRRVVAGRIQGASRMHCS